MVARYIPTDYEKRRAAAAGDGGEYGDETIVLLADGRQLRFPAYPESCSYIRVMFEGREITYWNSEEWKEDPEDVMGAIMGVLRSGMGGD